jgi:hypothetical protein
MIASSDADIPVKKMAWAETLMFGDTALRQELPERRCG